MADRRNGWPTGRIGWMIGTVVLLVLGVLIGLVLENIWLGLILALIISIGWMIAYESWLGRTPGVRNPDDDGARL